MPSLNLYRDARRHKDEILAIFEERLHRIADELYAPWIDMGAVKETEKRDEVMRYYQKKRSGLQHAYSYYGEQWDFFYKVIEATDDEFLPLLQQARSAFSRVYSVYELDFSFFHEQFVRYAYREEAWQTLRDVFQNKWFKLLVNREFDYQMCHIDRLCEDYYRDVRVRLSRMTNVGQAGDQFSFRLFWLQQKQSQALREKLRQLARLIKGSRLIRELNQRLGRQLEDDQRLYKAMAGRIGTDKVRVSSRSDIVGVTEGDNLNSLLPIEYCYLADEELQHAFIRRFTEKKLVVFDSVSRKLQPVRPSPRKGKDLPGRQNKGPFVACVDTSASMRGDREDMAKAIVLSLAMRMEKLCRPCKVILFSEQIEVIELRNLYEDLPLLENFLCQSFHGGTDIQGAIEEAVTTLRHADFIYADLLWISDFEMNPISQLMQQYIIELQQRGLRLYAVAFGGRYDSSYLKIADKYWLTD